MIKPLIGSATGNDFPHQIAGRFMSPDDLSKARRLKATDTRQHLRPADLSPEVRQTLHDAQVPAEFDGLNALMQD
ncbi:hypothetical protein P7L78_10650 [Tistrella bauzanensis]|uniref:Uncharacterized protein n=1 Tax=Tistrella arctica TaxID=3133430 RepID=A0ABU9YQW6_9PROT